MLKTALKKGNIPSICLVPKPIIPSPLDHEWEMVEDEIAIKWNTVKHAPEEVLALMFCTCSRK